MNYRQALIAISLASGLAACATTSDYGLSYQDGGYYSPAAEGRGDYYVGADFQRSYYMYDDYDMFFGRGFGGWYDSPFYSYGGYCSVRYRYCPRWAWGDGFGSPYGEAGFQIYFGSPWDPYWGHDPYWGRDYYPRRHHRGARPAAPGTSPAPSMADGYGPDDPPGPRQADGYGPDGPPGPRQADGYGPDGRPGPRQADVRRPPPRERVRDEDSEDSRFQAPRSERRSPAPRRSQDGGERRPSPKQGTSDGN